MDRSQNLCLLVVLFGIAMFIEYFFIYFSCLKKILFLFIVNYS